MYCIVDRGHSPTQVATKTSKASKRFPKTMRLIARSGVPTFSAYIHHMPPHKKLEKHVGSYQGVLRYQLGLKTPPPDSPGKCALTVHTPKPNPSNNEEAVVGGRCKLLP